MLKNLRNLILTQLFIILANIGTSAHEIYHTDTLLTLLESKSDDLVKQKQLTKLFYNRFLLSSCYDSQIKDIGNTLNQHRISGSQEIVRVARIYILRRLNNLPTAEKELVEAIGDAEVRKPLANILAICALLKEKDNTEEDTNSYYEILDQQVREMDQKLKEVEVKLHEYN